MIVRILISLSIILCCSRQFLAHPSWGIAVNEEEEIYLADVLHGGLGCVWKISSSGQAAMVLENFHCHALQAGSDGYIYAAGSCEEQGREWQTVVRIAPGGRCEELFRVAEWEEFFAGLFGVDRFGNFFFAHNKQVWQRSPKGRVRAYSNHRFEWVNNLAAAPDGTIYIVVKDKKGGTLYCIEPDGKTDVITSGIMATPADTAHCTDAHDRRILGMELGREGNVYLASNCGRQILKLSPSGEQEVFYKSKGGWYPLGLTFHNGMAYIIEVKHEKHFHGPRLLRWEAGREPVELILLGNTTAEEKKEAPPWWLWVVFLGSTCCYFIARFHLNRIKYHTRPY